MESENDGRELERVISTAMYFPDFDPPGYPHNGEILAMKKGTTYSQQYSEVAAELVRNANLRLDPKALVMPVPPRIGEFESRGLVYFAGSLSKQLNIKGVRGLIFSSSSLPQKQLSEPERRTNVAGKMTCQIDVRGMTTILVDDVLTTGNTMKEAARCLRNAGAWRIIGVTAARTVHLSHLVYLGLAEGDSNP